MRGKFSLISGRAPNLMPGQWGVNLADAILFMRAAGKMLWVRINDIIQQSAPAKGALGAPLRQGANGYEIAAELAPLGAVNGAIHVDAPPTLNQNLIPGVSILVAATPYAIAPDTLLIEPFYVASEDFVLTRLAFFQTTADLTTIKFGIATAAGVILIEDNMAMQTIGMNGTDITLPLAPGHYHAFLWSDDPLNLRSFKTTRTSQSFTLDGAGQPIFTRRRFGASGAYKLTALPAIIVTSADTTAEPGEDRCLFLQWNITA